MSKPVIYSVETEAFCVIGDRARERIGWNMWDAISTRMTIRTADNAWILSDIIESAMLARHV